MTCYIDVCQYWAMFRTTKPTNDLRPPCDMPCCRRRAAKWVEVDGDPYYVCDVCLTTVEMFAKLYGVLLIIRAVPAAARGLN